MIGSFLTRGLVMVLGYAYPAYECYKTVEKNKPEIEQLRFWCQYWILVAFLTVFEKFGDTFVSWIPMYSEVKLLFIVYLWYPKTKGTTYVYDSFFKPYLAKHENEIDRNLLELKTRAGDVVVLYWQRAACYGQTRIFEILQYVAAQSTPRPRPSQPQGARVWQPPAGQVPSVASNRQPAAATKLQQPEEPSSPTSSTASSRSQKEKEEELASLQIPRAATEAAASNSQNQAAANSSSQKAAATPEKSSQSAPTEVEQMQMEALPSSSQTENANPPPKDMVMEETIQVTRGRSRKTHSGAQ